jgi:hypothetical protein
VVSSSINRVLAVGLVAAVSKMPPTAFLILGYRRNRIGLLPSLFYYPEAKSDPKRISEPQMSGQEHAWHTHL